MSNIALTWAFQQPLKGPRKAVLIALADRADDAGLAYPSLGDIAFRAGVAERAARGALRDLEADGLLATEHRTGHRSHYRLRVDAATPARGAAPDCANTPAPDAGGGGTTCRGGRHEVPGTPARGAPKPSLTLIEPSVNPQRDTRTEQRTRQPTPDTKATRRQAARQAPRPIPAAWQPDEAGVAFAHAKAIADIAGELERFINHHQAKGSLMADWRAAWRTWCSNSARFAAERAARNRPTAATPTRNPLVEAAMRAYADSADGDNP